jgi:hypothetical protein
MEGLGINGPLQVYMQFCFPKLEDKLLKTAINLAGDGAAPDKSASTSLFDIINVHD